MATDGVKIIDGDLAHDTYWGIMDLYDSGVEIEEIRKEMPFEIDINGDDFSIEVFVTSYALAFWELGAISDKILGAVKSVMTKGACVSSWTERYGEKAGKARQRELEKLWHKINLDNSKIRNRKKYRKVSHFHFNTDDLLVFKRDVAHTGPSFVHLLSNIGASAVMYWFQQLSVARSSQHRKI
jgi:hypothetical protein